MIHPITIDIAGRKVSFSMDLDPRFPSDGAIMWYLRQDLPCEPEVVNLMARVCQPGDFVVDCGANVGFFTLLMSQYVGATGRVLAVEPGHNNLHKFQRNVTINKEVINITFCDAPLAAKPGPVQFNHAADSGSNACWFDPKATVVIMEMQATTLDAICDEMPKLIKMDIEGSELEALCGAAKLLKKHPPYIVAELNARALKQMGTDPAAVSILMKNAGYDLFQLRADGGIPFYMSQQSLREWHPERENTNVLFSTQADVDKTWPNEKP